MVSRIVEGGFVRVTTVVEGLETFAGHQVTLEAKNEFYIAQYLETGGPRPTPGPVLACTPDLICVVDSDSGEAILKSVSVLSDSALLLQATLSRQR